MCNSNWADLARSIGVKPCPDEGYCAGSISAEEIPEFIRGCLRLVNSKLSAEKASRTEEISLRANGSARMYSPGTSPEYVAKRSTELMSILTFARQKGVGVYWG